MLVCVRVARPELCKVRPRLFVQDIAAHYCIGHLRASHRAEIRATASVALKLSRIGRLANRERALTV